VTFSHQILDRTLYIPGFVYRRAMKKLSAADATERLYRTSETFGGELSAGGPSEFVGRCVCYLRRDDNDDREKRREKCNMTPTSRTYHA